jgi:hypothetical protein
LKEKDEVERLTEKIQVTIQNLFKEVPEVPLVVEATVEEKVSKISTLSRDSRTRSPSWNCTHSTRDTTRRKRTKGKDNQTSVEKIKILEQECIKMCDEGTHIWTELTNNPELQALEEKIRTMQEQVHQATERVNTLPPTERMTTLLANRKLYSAVEQMKEEQWKITQEL